MTSKESLSQLKVLHNRLEASKITLIRGSIRDPLDIIHHEREFLEVKDEEEGIPDK